jgi:alpha-methylacyl-CoA racemase
MKENLSPEFNFISLLTFQPFRPGVMERLGIGPEILMNENPQLIYARLTGFGQNGIYSERAGHDINYIAVSGLLSMFGRKSEKPTAPINLAADFAAGSLSCAFGICIALIERHRSGKGQIVDCAMVDGSAYVASWLFRSRDLPIWSGKRGENMLDTGHHSYDTYETKDGKFMAVGALEPQFYSELLKGLNLTEDEAPQFSNVEENKRKFSEIFKTKTESEWREIFDKLDACTFPVIEWNEAHLHEHNQANKTFDVVEGKIIPQPAPKLSRTPGKSGVYSNEHKKSPTTMAKEILCEIGFSTDEIKQLHQESVLILNEGAKL